MTTSQFLFLADAESFLKSHGFHLIPDSWDWTNAAGDDAGVYATYGRYGCITPRTFYRWRRQFGGLDIPAVRQMKDLVSENLRLRGLVSNMFERLRTPDDNAPEERRTLKATAPRTEDERARDQMRASRIAAEKCGGALTGHFASVRVNR
jgi:putative transposase